MTALSADEERERSVAAFRRRVQRLKGHAADEPKEKLVREVTIPETITIQELANRMAERGVDVIKLLMKQGHMAQINDVIDADTAQLLAEELGHTVKRVAEVRRGRGTVRHRRRSGFAGAASAGGDHHGPRRSRQDLAARRHPLDRGGGGRSRRHHPAYRRLPGDAPRGSKITFLDTPGHAAFTAMRARGAKVTDIVVLVVAADDGVMPQTMEAINHAKAAGVPMIVAINKIDKPDAKPERVRTELLQHEIQVETLGGDVLDVEVSATKRLNLDQLLETIGLQSEMLDLKANPNRPAEGTVIEAKLDRGRGPVATVLVQRGTLKVGDIIVAGADWGRVRALVSDTGRRSKARARRCRSKCSASAARRTRVTAWRWSQSEGRAREVADYRAPADGATRWRPRNRHARLARADDEPAQSVRPEGFGADHQGRRARLARSDHRRDREACHRRSGARVIHSGVGGITESDVTLAEASGVPIIGFNVRAHKEAREAAERAGIEIRYYNIIYDLVDDVKKAMSGLLAPSVRETMLGNATIMEIFKVSKVGSVAGCRVTDGVVERGANVRLIRDSVVVHEGKLSQLKRFKDDAREVVAGQECGMAFENYQDMKVGDVIECYRVETVQRSL